MSKSWVTISLVALGLGNSSVSRAVDNLYAEYFCSKYEGRLIFADSVVLKDFGVEFPAASEMAPSGLWQSKLSDCSSGDMFCVEELGASSRADRDFFVFAIPKTLLVGQRYEVRGIRFKVMSHVQFRNAKPSVVIMAEGKRLDRGVLRYKMYVEAGSGIREFYFEQLHGLAAGSSSISRSYSQVSCSLVNKRGLFSDVEMSIANEND